MITGPYQHAHAFGGGSSNTITDYPIKPICEYLNQTEGIEASFASLSTSSLNVFPE